MHQDPCCLGADVDTGFHWSRRDEELHSVVAADTPCRTSVRRPVNKVKNVAQNPACGLTTRREDGDDRGLERRARRTSVIQTKCKGGHKRRDGKRFATATTGDNNDEMMDVVDAEFVEQPPCVRVVVLVVDNAQCCLDTPPYCHPLWPIGSVGKRPDVPQNGNQALVTVALKSRFALLHGIFLEVVLIQSRVETGHVYPKVGIGHRRSPWRYEPLLSTAIPDLPSRKEHFRAHNPEFYCLYHGKNVCGGTSYEGIRVCCRRNQLRNCSVGRGSPLLLSSSMRRRWMLFPLPKSAPPPR